MFHCFTFFLVIRFCILRLSLNAPALHQLFYGVSPQGEEKFYQPFVWDNMVGSPPRGRGKVIASPGNLVGQGITPAWAGKRKLIEEGDWESKDHPRMGGEKPHPVSQGQCQLGSPPRGRGKDFSAVVGDAEHRITPA